MNILVVGGTGFIGRSIVASLLGSGHEIIVSTRNFARAEDLLGGNIALIDLQSDTKALTKALEWADAVINLAGENLAGIRWNAGRKKDFYDSRVGVTRLMSEQIATCTDPPEVFISASAVGIYGDRGAEWLDENSSMGSGYLADLCKKWEEAARYSAARGTRVVTLRLGVVVGREGGILRKLMQSFGLGLGSYVGHGDQKVPWIHLYDVIRAVEFCLTADHIRGAINVTSPRPSTSKEFALELAKVAGVRAVIPIPGFALRIVFGEGAQVLTASQNAAPWKLMDSGFEFIYESLQDALEEELHPETVEVKRLKSRGNQKSIGVPKNHKGCYQLTSSVILKSTAETTFEFFSAPPNLALSTPSWVGFHIKKMPDEMKKGSEIEYRIKLGPFSMNWRSVISVWEPGESFVDYQQEGPYSLWNHEHVVLDHGVGRCVAKDVVTYNLPFGLIGRIAHFLFVKKLLIRIFGFRRRVMQMRFN